MRVKLTVAYDGTNYCGWQVQPNGISIEEVLNGCLSDLFSQDIKVIGASRTDSGVHADGNVCIFDVDTRMDATKIAFALNQRLPEDVSIQESCQVEDDFHPRYGAKEKTYEYRILNCTHRKPLNRIDTYFYHYPLDVEAMDKAIKCLVGEHDFTSFASIHRQAKTTVRTIYDAAVTKSGDVVTIRLTGNGFLYNMVRIVAGTLIEVGGGKRTPESIVDVLNACEREAAGPTAPPEGLTLKSIRY